MFRIQRKTVLTVNIIELKDVDQNRIKEALDIKDISGVKFNEVNNNLEITLTNNPDGLVLAAIENHIERSFERLLKELGEGIILGSSL